MHVRPRQRRAAHYAGARRWYRRAAEQGLAAAQHEVGRMYGSGRGGPKDEVQAYKWLDLAASGLRRPPPRIVRKAGKDREAVAQKMSPQQVGPAQQLAREWKAK